MMRRTWLYLAILAWPGCGFAACVVTQRAVVPLEIIGTTVLAPVVVNGIPGTFVVDTGAVQTAVTPDAVTRFQLALDEWTATTLRGIGGIERHRNADPRSVELGGVPLYRRSLAHDKTLRVVTFSRGLVAGHRVDGLLGRDFLSVFDVDLDFPHRTLTLYDVAGCSGRFLPWAGPYLSVAVENPIESAIVVPVAVDGVRLRALLDSGASRTMIAAPGMARLGLDLDHLRDDPNQIISGIGTHTVMMWQHQFHELQVGTETFANPRFLVAPIQLQPTSDLLLGADWLMGRRVWISYATHQMFATK
jgi:predicted aspartyl protease